MGARAVRTRTASLSGALSRRVRQGDDAGLRRPAPGRDRTTRHASLPRLVRSRQWRRTPPDSTCKSSLRMSGSTVRLVRREKWFAIAAIGTIAIGIGAATPVFSVGKSMLVDALPYPDADRATMVWVSNPRQGFDRDFTSYPRLVEWRTRARLIDTFAAYTLPRCGRHRDRRLRATPRRQSDAGILSRRSCRAGRRATVRGDRGTISRRRAQPRLLAAEIRRAIECGRSHAPAGLGPLHHHRRAAAVVPVPRT